MRSLSAEGALRRFPGSLFHNVCFHSLGYPDRKKEQVLLAHHAVLPDTWGSGTEGGRRDICSITTISRLAAYLPLCLFLPMPNFYQCLPMRLSTNACTQVFFFSVPRITGIGEGVLQESEELPRRVYKSGVTCMRDSHCYVQPVDAAIKQKIRGLQLTNACCWIKGS